jgi:hypothetical protein
MPHERALAVRPRTTLTGASHVLVRQGGAFLSRTHGASPVRSAGFRGFLRPDSAEARSEQHVAPPVESTKGAL